EAQSVYGVWFVVSLNASAEREPAAGISAGDVFGFRVIELGEAAANIHRLVREQDGIHKGAPDFRNLAPDVTIPSLKAALPTFIRIRTEVASGVDVAIRRCRNGPDVASQALTN